MTIEQTAESAVPVLHLNGKLDATTGFRLEEALEALWKGGENRVVLDCAGLRYVSSAGLQVFLVAGKILAGRGGRMVFCGLGPWMGDIFALTQFAKLFPVYETAAEAAASF